MQQEENFAEGRDLCPTKRGDKRKIPGVARIRIGVLATLLRDGYSIPIDVSLTIAMYREMIYAREVIVVRNILCPFRSACFKWVQEHAATSGTCPDFELRRDGIAVDDAAAAKYSGYGTGRSCCGTGSADGWPGPGGDSRSCSDVCSGRTSSPTLG